MSEKSDILSFLATLESDPVPTAVPVLPPRPPAPPGAASAEKEVK